MKIMDEIGKWCEYYAAKEAVVNSFNIAYLLKVDGVEFPGYSNEEIVYFIKLYLNESILVPLRLLVDIADTLQRTTHLHNFVGDDLGERARNTLAKLQAYL